MLHDFDLVDSLKASNVRKNPCAFLQDSGAASLDDEPVRQVRQEIRQKLNSLEEDDDELEIDMEASDLRLRSDFEYVP